MNPERILQDPRRQQAIRELQGMILAKYPTATFTVAPGVEDHEETWLTARVDLDDPDEVMDIVIERLGALQDDEGLPVYVLPLRTPERVTALRRLMAGRRRTVAALPHVVPRIL